MIRKWFLETSHKKTKPSIMSLLNLEINWADTRKRHFCESLMHFPFKLRSSSIFSYVKIQKHLLENYDGQAFDVIQVLNITCSPSLK